MLTADQVLRLAGDDVGFISADDLADIKSTKQLFERFNKIILLYLHYKSETDMIGHYVCLINHPNSIEFSDSYKMKPDDILMMKSKKDRESTDQTHNSLARLLYNSGRKIEYNSVQLQSKDPKVATCGFWSAIRCRFSDIPIEIWEQFWKDQKKKHPGKNDLDRLVVRMCNLL